MDQGRKYIAGLLVTLGKLLNSSELLFTFLKWRSNSTHLIASSKDSVS